MELWLPSVIKLGWCESKDGGCPAELPAGDARLVIKSRSPVQYVDPVALAMLAAWSERMRSSGASVDIDESLKSVYSWRSGLLSALAGRFDQCELSSDKVLRKRVAKEQEIEALVGEIRLLSVGGKLSETAPVDLDKAVRYFVSEMLRNVFEHSQSPLGAYVCGGYFPTTDRVSFAVVDVGVTVPRHIQARWKEKVDEEVALRIALEPRVSGSLDSSQNAGLGLFMVRRIVTLMGGKFWMMTGNLVARDGGAWDAGARGELEVARLDSRWPGCAVGLSLFPSRYRSFAEQYSEVRAEIEGEARGDKLDVFRKHPASGSYVIPVTPDVLQIAQNKLAAAEMRDQQILPALGLPGEVCIDFRDVRLTTQSYVHALVAEPLRRLGVEGVKKRVRFTGARDQVKQVLKIVLSYVLSERDDG